MKERMLTVLVPILEEETIEVGELPTVDSANVNVIYKHEGVYKRLWRNPNTNRYEYQTVVDREFPYVGKPMEIFDFTYDATRMGSAPTISAQNVMWYADKDSDGNDVTLEDLFYRRCQDCHVRFDGKNYYLSRVPTCKKDSKDARYIYNIDFVSEDKVLEEVYLYDVVQPFITERPISENAKFSFYGDVHELAKRINASLLRSGLSYLSYRQNSSWTLLAERPSDWYTSWGNYFEKRGLEYVKLTDIYIQQSPAFSRGIFYEFGHPRLLSDGVTLARDDQYFTYSEWCAIKLGTYDGPLSVNDVYLGVTESTTAEKHVTIFDHYNGDYNAYLRNEVFLTDDNGDAILNGYVCKIGMDVHGKQTTSDEKLITFDNNTIHETLQKIHDTFGLQYYITKEKDSNGEYTGNTLIVVADCEHDFADVEGEDFVRDAEGIPTTEHPFDYGFDNELLSKEKTNTTDKIITRITGTGSSENIPWYYPNPTADGWIKPIYKRGNEVLSVDIEYPNSYEDVRYERYLKNRLGQEFQYGKRYSYISNHSYVSSWGPHPSGLDGDRATIVYEFEVKENSVIKCSPICSYSHISEITYMLYRGGTEVSSQSTQFLLTGGTGHLDAGKYHLVYNFTFSERPHVVDNVDLYFYDAVYTDYNGYATFPLSQVILAIPQVISGNASFVSNYPPFLSTNPNLKFHWNNNLSLQGWYDGDNRIDWNDVVFFEDDTVHYAFVGGDGVKTLGHDDIIKVSGSERMDGITDVDYVAMNYVDYRPVNRIYNAIPFIANVVIGSGGLSGWTYKSIERGIDVSLDDFISKYWGFTLEAYLADGWYLNGEKISLDEYGMNFIEQGHEYVIDDIIGFQRVKYVTPQPTLMPELYIKTDGERRFYDAHNYDPVSGSAEDVDALIGEEYVNRMSIDGTAQRGVINKIYSPDGDGLKHYDFENEYLAKHPHEHIEQFEDIKPTIAGQINTVDGRSFRVDVIEEFAYDELDDDEIWESNDGGNISGEYKHPYFFAKLRPLGFNLFDLALQDDMVLSMTTGHCGACNFRIGVDENTQKNPVQIWEYDVYEGADYATKLLKYHAGELRRYIDISNLYYDKTGTIEGYTPVTPTAGVSINPASQNMRNIFQRLFRRAVYSANMVKNGEVGALKQENKSHFVGDVMTSGRFIESQQDTSDNYVWVALMKDTDSYGVIMPSAKPDYADGNYSVYIRPKSFTDTGDEEKADKFVLTNIRMPQIYLRRAERELSRRLVESMYDSNYQKFNFSIGFSRIFLAQNPNIEDILNENSVMYVSFNNRTYRQYAKHYTYRMANGNPLPEISVDMNEELSVSRTKREKDAAEMAANDFVISERVREAISSSEQRIGRRTIGRNSDTLVGGNIVNVDAATSLHDLQIARMSAAATIANTQIDLEVNHFKKSDFAINGQKLEIGGSISVPTKSVFDNFVSSVNTFNAGSAQRLNQIKETIEHRLPSAAGGTLSGDCPSYKFNHNELTHTTELLWYNSDGTVVTIPDSVCSTSTNMTSISWENFETN